MTVNRLTILLPALLLLLCSCGPGNSEPEHNTLSKKEIRNGWELLFDGESFDGWQGINVEENRIAEERWEIKDGEIRVIDPLTEDHRIRRDIVTNKRYSNFELSFEFRLSEGANGGIKYFVNPDWFVREGKGIGVEFQLLDEQNVTPASDEQGSGSAYGLKAPLPSIDTLGPEKWHAGMIRVKGAIVEHWLNGRLAVRYTRDSDEFAEWVKESKFKSFEGYGRISEGHILIQDHGSVVFYRNLKIRKLPPHITSN